MRLRETNAILARHVEQSCYGDPFLQRRTGAQTLEVVESKPEQDILWMLCAYSGTGLLGNKRDSRSVSTTWRLPRNSVSSLTRSSAGMTSMTVP